MTSHPSPGTPAPRSRSRLPWLIGGLCALLALIVGAVAVIGALWFLVLRPTPQDAVEQYLVAWDTQDCEAYEEVTTESFRGGPEYTCEQWQEILEEQSDFTFEQEIGEIEVDGDRASVEVIEDGTADGVTHRSVYACELVKQDGKWLLDGITTLQEPREI